MSITTINIINIIGNHLASCGFIAIGLFVDLFLTYRIFISTTKSSVENCSNRFEFLISTCMNDGCLLLQIVHFSFTYRKVFFRKIVHSWKNHCSRTNLLTTSLIEARICHHQTNKIKKLPINGDLKFDR